MGWFDKFFPKKTPQVKTPTETKIEAPEEVKTSSAWQKLWETALEGSLTERAVSKPYSQVVSVYKAVKAIADNVPQAELIFKDYESEKEIYPKELMSLFDNPNPLMTRNEFMQACAGYIALYGEVAIIKTLSVGQAAGTRNLPAELWPVNPSNMTEITAGNKITGWKHNAQTFSPEEVIFIKDFNPYSIFRGIAPTEVLKKIIEIDWSQLLYAKAFFENDATPGFMLTTEKPLTEQQRNRMSEWLAKATRGASKAFRSLILDNGIQPKTVSSTAKDSDLEGQRNYTREEILGVFRAPKALFNITDTLNYATFMGQMKVFWIYGIEPILRKLEDAFNKHVILPFNPKIYVEFDTSNVPAFQEDFKEKVTSAKVLFDMGFTANEINEKLKLGFEPKPWRDQWWVSFGMLPADPALASDLATSRSAAGAQITDPEEKSAKGIETSARLWRGFVRLHESIETKFDKKLQAYFYQQRVKVLRGINDKFGKAPAFDLETKHVDFGMDWAAEDAALKKLSSIYLLQAIQAGAEYGSALAKQDLQLEAVRAAQEMMMNSMTSRITRVNRTIRRQLNERVNGAVKDGIMTGQTMDQIAEAVKDSVRAYYNVVDTRAKLIARTEVTGAMNGGSLLYYKSIGATGKKWITANDEHVRAHHRMNQDEGVVPIDDVFKASNMQAPGVGDDPREVCNCRCSIAPTFD